jgi:hypothetical protein
LQRVHVTPSSSSCHFALCLFLERLKGGSWFGSLAGEAKLGRDGLIVTGKKAWQAVEVEGKQVDG